MEVPTDPKGKQRRVNPRYETLWDVYWKLPNAGRYLKAGETLQSLATKARAESDTEVAKRMQQAKGILFADLFPVNRTA